MTWFVVMVGSGAVSLLATWLLRRHRQVRREAFDLEDKIGGELAQVADLAVKHAAELGYTLDYSEESLVVLDQILAKITEHGLLSTAAADAEDPMLLARLYGAYLGEVVLRTFGGRWEVQTGQNKKHARLVLCTAEAEMYPEERILKRLTRDVFDNTAGYCRVLRTMRERRR